MAGRKGAEWAWLRFSIADVSRATGRSVLNVRRDAARGLVDRRDVRSVARYVVGLAPISAVAREAYLRLGMALGMADEPGSARKPDWEVIAPNGVLREMADGMAKDKNELDKTKRIPPCNPPVGVD